jgi:hypothetical protein
MLGIPGAGVTGQLLASGSTTVSAPNCILGTNSTLADAISIGGLATVTATSLTSSGGCVGCDAATLERSPATYAAPSTNPLAYVERKPLPNFTSASCTRDAYILDSKTNTYVVDTIPGNNKVTTSLVIAPPAAGRALCGLAISGTGTVVTLNPGTYYFFDSSLTMTGGTLQCRLPGTPTNPVGAACPSGQGVTIVFTGSSLFADIGGPNITGSTINLTAPTAAGMANNYDPNYPGNKDYAGILFFRDRRSTGGNN